jgi:hypothetical protein
MFNNLVERPSCELLTGIRESFDMTSTQKYILKSCQVFFIYVFTYILYTNYFKIYSVFIAEMVPESLDLQNVKKGVISFSR